MSVRFEANRDVERTVLANGLRVITEKMPHMRSASVGIWIGTGAREETLELTGISHFIEHMLFKGTKNRTAEEIARSADSIGGGLDAFTSKELVSYNVKVLDEHIPQAFDIISDLVRNPLFEKADIDKEKGVILEELKMEVDNPEYAGRTRSSPPTSGRAIPSDAPFSERRKPFEVSIAIKSKAITKRSLYAEKHPGHRRRGNLSHLPPRTSGRGSFRRLEARARSENGRPCLHRTPPSWSAIKVPSSRCMCIWAFPRLPCLTRIVSPATF